MAASALVGSEKVVEGIVVELVTRLVCLESLGRMTHMTHVA